MNAYKSTQIYMEDGKKDGFLITDGGKITGFERRLDGKNVTDLGDLRVIPGIFDTHNHGTCGYGIISKGTKEEVRGYLKGCASQGITGVFPTADLSMISTVAEVAEEQAAEKAVMEQGGETQTAGRRSAGEQTAVMERGGEMQAAGRRSAGEQTAAKKAVGERAGVAQAVRAQGAGARILGIHSEGPWLNRTGEKGIRTGWPGVSMETAEKMLEDGKGLLRLVAMAPEIPGIREVASYFLSKGLVLALAHSDCGYEAAQKAYESGFSVATHTGNVMTGMHHRDVGGLGAALLNDQVDCEVICDGKHVCLEMLKIYFRIKSTDRFMMVSDCTPFSGAPAGVYRGIGPGMRIQVTDDGFVLTDTGRLMGSSQPVLYGIGNLVEKLGLPMETALRMASLNPSRKYGFESTKGSLKPGKDADFVVISDDYTAVSTYVCGRKVYDCSEGAYFNPHFLKEWNIEGENNE